MSILLEDVMRERQEQVEKMPKNITLRQAEDIDTMNSILNAMPRYKASKTERFMSGVSAALEGFADVAPAIEIYGRKANLAIGGYFGASPEEIERKKLNLATAMRNFQNAQRERFKYSNPEDTESLAFGLGQGAVNYGTMLVGGFGVGTTSRALGLSAAKTAAAETAAGLVANAAFENVEQQSERLPLDTAGNVDIKQITPKWAAKSIAGTTAYLATSAILEKYVGFGKQVKMWETPINFSNAQLKALSPVLKSAGKSMLSEGATEGLQSLASSGILLAEGVIKPADMPDRLQQAWKEAVIGGILGGSVGTAVAINQQHNVKTMLNDEIGKVIQDPDEREAVVEAIYDSGTTEMTNVISKELELSSELNTKHGAIYENMSAAITQAIQESGAFSNASESDLAQYVSETSKMFANQVLAEANKRGVLIDEVLKASDIKYADGKIQLNAGNQTIAETPIYSTDVNAQIVTDTENNNLYQSAETAGADDDNLEAAQKEWQEKGTESKYFKKWFDDSKVVDENGKPLVVYHGTTVSNIEIFEPNRASTDFDYPEAIYFSDSLNIAKTYGDTYHKTPMQVYLKMENPLELDAQGQTYNDFYDELKRELKYAVTNNDGVIVRNIRDDWAQNDGGEIATTYIVFNPEQIKSVNNQGTFDAGNPNIYYQEEIPYNSFNDFENEFKESIEEAPADYEINNVEDALKDLGITKNKPRIVNTPIGSVSVKASSIEHIINGGDSSLHKPDQSRYKSINKMFAVLEKPEIITMDENRKKKYIKLFKGKNKSKAQIAVVYNDKNGDYVYTTIPVTKHKNYILKEVNSGNIIYKKGQTREDNFSAANNIITDLTSNINPTLNQVKGLPKQPKEHNGYYSVPEQAIKLLQTANYSTLPHEFAHFWLENIWTYAKSGKASEAYMNNFKAIEDFLNIKPYQVYLTTPQHEKFAKAYEKYLYNGYAPNGIIAGAFDDYDRWLKQVYNDARELKVKLTPEAIEFFDSMTTGQLPEYTVEETQREIIQKEYPKAVKEAQKVVAEKQAEYNAVPVNNTTVPVNTAGEKARSRAYTKQAAILGLADELNYNRISIEEQNKKAEEFVKADLERAQRIATGRENPPADILKNAIYNAYLREMLAIGNNEAYLEALQNQSLELTRAGQEIASQRGAIENIFDAAYWVRRIENNLKTQKAIQKFGRFSDGSSAVQKMDNFIKGKIDAVIPEFMAADNESRKSIAKKLAEDIAAEFGTRPTELFQMMREPSELRTRTNAYNYLYKTVNEALGISLNSNQANEVIARADAMQKAIENTRDRNGNPSALFFKNMSAMEDYANSLAPTPSLTVLTSIVGRGNMLLSPKSIALNIESNYLNFLTEALTRRVANGSTAQLVDSAAIKEYLDYSRNVYNASGYQVSTMEELDATRQILSEGIVTSQGEGKIRALGRFFEQTIFKYGLGFPDLISKDFTFVDTVNLLATQKSGGSSEKATAIFKDACLIEPKTQLGRDIRQAAISEALTATYQNKGKLSDVALKIRGAINQASGQLRLGDLLSPFVKTPANVIGLGLDYTFGGLRAVKNITTIINDFKRGSFTEITRNSLRSLARNGLGFFVSQLIASMIDDDDYIPDYAVLNSKERELVKLKNGVFNSVKIGDRYVSLDYFGPLAMPLVSILNARRGEDLQEQVFKYIQGAGVQSMKVPVIGDLKEVLEGTGRTLSQDVEANIKMLSDATVDFLSSRTVPAIVSDIAKITDDYERDTEKSAINRFKSRIPVLREDLPAKYNYATGRPVETENAFSVFLAGARVKKETLSPVIRELDRLSDKNTENKVTLSMVTKSGKLSELKPAQKRKAEVEFAKNYASEVKTLIKTPYYKSLDDESKVKAINKIRANIRKSLKERYL